MSFDRLRAEEILHNVMREASDARSKNQWKEADEPYVVENEALYEAVSFILQQMIQRDDKERDESPPVLDNPGFLSSGG